MEDLTPSIYNAVEYTIAETDAISRSSDPAVNCSRRNAPKTIYNSLYTVHYRTEQLLARPPSKIIPDRMVCIYHMSM